MADTGKPAWPQTPDGTTDWEVVFENAETGFIQLVAQSPSAEILRQTATVVIEQLFTRRGDEVVVTHLKNQLETILTAPTELIAKQAGVSGLLREIKDARIEKARVYIERKRAGAAIDRRAGLMWKINVLMKPKVLVPVGFVFVLLLSGLVYGVLQSTLGSSPPTPVAEAPEEAPVEGETAPAGEAAQDKPSAAGAEAEAEAEAEARSGVEAEPGAGKTSSPPESVDTANVPTDATPPEPKPIRIWLKTMRWPLSSHSTTERPQYYAVILYVPDWDTKVEVCRRVANVMDQLYQSFNRVLPQDRKASDEQLKELEDILPNILDQIYGYKMIDKVEVVRYGDPRFNSAGLPPYCKSPDKPK